MLRLREDQDNDYIRQHMASAVPDTLSNTGQMLNCGILPATWVLLVFLLLVRCHTAMPTAEPSPHNQSTKRL